jgi:nucleoside-diphosphate-sugar epimerase
MVDTNNRVLVTGATGQIGSALITKLQSMYGEKNVISSGRRTRPEDYKGIYEILDVLDKKRMLEVVKQYDVQEVYHLAAILSAKGENNPDVAWTINIEGFQNVLDLARDRHIQKIFHPSSIAAFGPETPRDMTPQETVLKPRTMYGVTKVTGELLGNYYFEKYGVDVRGARLPGIISNVAPPGGGTTDYAVEIFYEAIKNNNYTCFLKPDATLPMMYMPDCLKAFIDLMQAPLEELNHHTDFNLAAMSFSPVELAAEICNHLSEFKIRYDPDFRQKIAETWPKSIDDSCAREEWGWSPDYDLPSMVADMLCVLGARYKRGDF